MICLSLQLPTLQGRLVGSIRAPALRNIGNEGQQNDLHLFFEELKKFENRVAWFLAEPRKAKKDVQKDKQNQRGAELVRAGLAPCPNLLLKRLSCPIEAHYTFCVLKSHPLWDQTGDLGVVFS